MQNNSGNSIEILLVEDNPGDQRLTQEALKDGKISNNLYIVEDGEEALMFLHRTGEYAQAVKPDLILLDLNLPGMNGQEVLKIIKGDEALKRIPVVILTTSSADEDILKAYNLNANCYITKPVDFAQFIKVINMIQEFWFTIVKLPKE
ncbi:MAG TPA: response regulator [Thermotogota bacterium]|nr:response regulator [Thermotogota bacterium]HPR97613.1 response regulator [Thermotogota bacterium]